MITRRRLTLAAAAAVGACPGWSRAQAQAPWDLATGYPVTSFHVQNLESFAADVRQASGGLLNIRVHPAGSLVKAPDVRAAVISGQVALGEVFGPSLGALHPVFGLDAMPFLATSYEAALRLWTTARPLARRRAADNGLALLMSVPWPPQGLFSGHEIRTIDDFKGHGMRENSPAVKRMAEILGAVPTAVESADLVGALQARRLRLIFTSAAQGVDTRIWDHLPWFYQANAWLPRNLLLMNQKVLDGLSPPLRDLVLSAAAAAEERGWQMSRDNAAQSLAALRAAGMKIGLLDSSSRSRLDRSGGELTADLMKRADSELLGVLASYLSGR